MSAEKEDPLWGFEEAWERAREQTRINITNNILAKLMQSAVLDDIDPKVLERVARVLGGEE